MLKSLVSGKKRPVKNQMTRRFSSRELSSLRNDIPIERVIGKFLALPSRRKANKRCFACPLCQNFNLSIHQKTNLARCFTCQRNFNAIEIVMAQRKLGFVESVKWIKRRHAENKSKDQSATNSLSAPAVPIGNILSKILPALPSERILAPASIAIPDRIANLEKKVEQLALAVEELRKSVFPK